MMKVFYTYIFFIILFEFIFSTYNNKTANENLTLNNILFNSIREDDYNLTTIFSYNYSTIKIQKQISNNKNPLVCVLGILANENGFKIEREMLKWLLTEYEVYKVYQKYPGTLYEYPALRFAQWLVEINNISFILYLHTKGATHNSMIYGDIYIRKFWEKEFTKPKNSIYISKILQNITDIATPLTYGITTWYNGMFISNRAFKLNNIYSHKNRYIYEYYFSNNKTRIQGIISENCTKPWKYLDIFNNKKENNSLSQISKITKVKDFHYNILHMLLYLILVIISKISLNIFIKKYLKY